MENGNITSTNPYNFTFGFQEEFEAIIGPKYTTGPYRIYFFKQFLLCWLILRSLNNVNLVLMNAKDLHKRVLNMNVTSWKTEHEKNAYGVLNGIIDTTVHFYNLGERSPSNYHISPYLQYDSYAIYSSVKLEKDEKMVLSIQGLGDLVWVLVALSLLVVSAVSFYIGNKKKMRRESRFTSFAESLWIHAADIVNNSVACAKKVAVPLRYTRAWWLLGVTFIIQFWCAGLKSDLLADDNLLIDSLEDLTSNPEIICYFTPYPLFLKWFEDEDSKFSNLRQQLRSKENVFWDLESKANEKFTRGEAVVLNRRAVFMKPALFKKLKRYKRKLYVGKTNYAQLYSHMFFNKRLPPAIKERIDYV